MKKDCDQPQAHPARCGCEPAGGEVEVLGYLVSCYSTRLSKAPGGADDETIELVDRAHVTRLQAENAALQQRLNVADQRVGELTADNARLQARIDETNEDFQLISEEAESAKRNSSAFEERMGVLQVSEGSLRAERDALKAEVEQLTRRCHNADVALEAEKRNKHVAQSELTKAQEELRLEKIVSEAMRTQANDWSRLAWQRKNNPDAEGKYDLTLLPFLKLMERELHANAYKGDRPAWLKLSAAECLLEIYYHVGKLHKAVHGGCKVEEVTEYAADVANLSMMLTDITGALGMVVKEMEPKVCECGPLRNVTNGGHFAACTRCHRRI